MQPMYYIGLDVHKWGSSVALADRSVAGHIVG